MLKECNIFSFLLHYVHIFSFTALYLCISYLYRDITNNNLRPTSLQTRILLYFYLDNIITMQTVHTFILMHI